MALTLWPGYSEKLELAVWPSWLLLEQPAASAVPNRIDEERVNLCHESQELFMMR